MEKGKVGLKVGKRVLFHISGKSDIAEGVVSEISPNGKLFKIGGRWYCGEPSLDSSGLVQTKILDILDGETREQRSNEEEDNDR